MAQGFEDQPLRRENFAAAIASLEHRKDRLVRRQQELERREAKVLVFGEPEAKPMGYGRAPRMPSYNLQSVVDVESGLIVHHDVYNDANDSHMLHPVSVAAKKVLEVDQIQVLTDGGDSNAEEINSCLQHLPCRERLRRSGAPALRRSGRAEPQPRFAATVFGCCEPSSCTACPAPRQRLAFGTVRSHGGREEDVK